MTTTLTNARLALQIDGVLGPGPHTALVAGGSRGLGGGYVDRLADAGCDLVLVSRSSRNLSDKLRETRERIAASGGSNRVSGVLADLSRPESVETIREEIPRSIDVAVFAAGTRVFDHEDRAAIERMIAIKRDTAPRLMHSLAADMRERPLAEGASYKGLLLLVSSVSALHEIGGLRSYSESNRYLADLGRRLAADHSGEIPTSVSFPGWVDGAGVSEELGRYHPGKAWGTRSVEQVVAEGLDAALAGHLEFVAESDRENLLVGQVANRVFGPGVSLAIASLWFRLTGTKDEPGPLFDSPLTQAYSAAWVSVARVWAKTLERALPR